MSEAISAQSVPPQDISAVVSSSNQALGGSTASLSTPIRTLDDLKTLAPPLHDAIMMSIALEIKRQQERANARFKQILREADQRQKS